MRIVGGDNDGESFSYRVTVNSNSVLTSLELKDRAAEEAVRISGYLNAEYDRMSGGSVEEVLEARIESAYRTREV